MPEAARLPAIDIGALRRPDADAGQRLAVARELDAAARTHGFFYAVNHGVDPALMLRLARLVRLSRRFFAQDEAQKMRIPMSAGGRAWRGYFPLGSELTSDRPDWKEGLYLGSELGSDHPRLRAGVILHGANLWPPIDGFRETLLAYIDALTALGRALMRGLALGLAIEEDWFERHGTDDPLIPLRLFNYPNRPVPPGGRAQWGVGEHTDYGLLTLLARTTADGAGTARTCRPSRAHMGTT